MRPSTSLTRQTSPHYAKALILYLLFFVLLWTVLTSISHKAPDLDGMEELVWASSFELGYIKHPPFPSWIMYGLTQLLGRPVWLSFFAGMLASAAGLVFLWLLAREFLSPRLSFLVVLLASVNIYFSLRGTIFNHNTAQLWSIMASIWFFYRACRDQRLSDWAWLGVVAGFALMTKYSAVIQFAAFFLYLLASGLWRHGRTWQGMLVATITLGITFSPHLYWLHSNDYAPFLYMDKSLAAPTRWQAYSALLSFTLDQLARLSPMIIAVGALYYCYRRDLRQKGHHVSDNNVNYGAQIHSREKQFLLWVGLSPFLSTVLIAALLGSHLDASWATTFFVLYSFYFLFAIKGAEPLQTKRLLVIVLIIQILMATGYALARGPLAWETGRKSRSTFPGPEIASQMQAVWRQHVPATPLRIVASDTWLGGNIAINTSPDAQVYIDAQLAQSPWLRDADLQCGILVVFSRQTRGEPAASLLQLYEQTHWKGLEQLHWSSANSPILDLNWGIIPPSPSCEAAR
ncbi:glycosyltransferase family 39 protein [Alcaligenes endophyticus]|uniref:Glycosyltransferase family 39 protein n=1 Tax=Alcaligenes endophyticus TaxID=1929088 RepID=A0ABT8EI06_9BURK|nr:glycosyltransferase family 39 protein [Alcaligenes endophyticus]MCX5592738.1 glycosyltransferase family 39 protein [Alcaligenes endophyticus]MDN4120926.1 glycosyltransferase family 39 protein [Alcaligenes endophyticus]